MTNQLKTLGIAALLAQSLVFFACSSSSPATGSGGSTGSGTGGDATAGASGTSGGQGGSASASALCPLNLGTCSYDDCTKANPDTLGTGACTSTCESSSCTTPCSQDCCVTCGIDGAGTKICTCMTPGSAFNNCVCSPPPGFPAGLSGGTCMPQGYAATMVPAGAAPGAISLKGMPCTVLNAVCFTTESTASSGRGCICMADAGGTMTLHCGSTNKWFLQVPGTTAY